MNTNNLNSISKWQEGIDYEIAFWNNVYRWKKTFIGTMNWSKYGKTIELDKFDANKFLISCKDKIVLDIGCGMSYATGYYIEKNGLKEHIDIHYIDPLAQTFNAILKKYEKRIRKRLNGNMLPSIEFGAMEYISAFYPNHNIDLAIIQNALDHSAMPVKGIIETIDTLRIGGILYLNHHPNEAETEHYKGFHQYNINEKNGNLIIWNKTEYYDINKIIDDFAEIKVCKGSDTKNIIAIITKRKDVPSEILKHKDDKKHLYTQMMLNIYNSNSIKYAIKRKFKYYYYNTIQFFIQSLSWERKMKIKKLIGQYK